MASISIAVDTKKRACALLVDGHLVDASSVYLSHSKYSDGKEGLYFEYAQKVTGPNGMEEVHCFRLAPPPDPGADVSAGASVNEQGLIEIPVTEAHKVGQDIATFLGRSPS